MPIVQVQVVGESNAGTQEGVAATLASAVGRVLQAAPGRVWVRVEFLPSVHYAENESKTQRLPVFVNITYFDLPAAKALSVQALALATEVGACLGREADQVHIEFAPPGRGRVAFGGILNE